MAFDSVDFVLNYPVASDVIRTETSADLVPSGTGMLKILFFDETFLGAEVGSYILTTTGIKPVQNLTNSDYVVFSTSELVQGSFRETVQGQLIRNFVLGNSISKKVGSVEPFQSGYGLDLPVYYGPENGGIQYTEQCLCVLFSDVCGTRLTTALATVINEEPEI